MILPPTTKSLNGIELRHLHCFLIAAHQGSFRKGAAALGVRESSVSRRVRDLENRLGRDLFFRSRSGVRLTAAGRGFLPIVHRVIVELNEGAATIVSMPQAAKQDSGDHGVEIPFRPHPNPTSCEEDELGFASKSMAGRSEAIALRQLFEAVEMLLHRIVSLSDYLVRLGALEPDQDAISEAGDEP